MADNRMLSEEPSARFAREQEEARRKERAAQDAEWIRTHGAVPGTPEWYKKTAEVNEVDRLTRNRDSILEKIRAIEQSESYNMPTDRGATAINRPGLEDFTQQSGIYMTPEGGYSNIGSAGTYREPPTDIGSLQQNVEDIKRRIVIAKGGKDTLGEYEAKKKIDLKYKDDKGGVGSIARKKAALKSAYPTLDNKTLTGLAAGTIKTSHNPVSDEVTLVDMVKGTATPLGASPKDAKQIVPKKLEPDIGPTVFDLREYIAGPKSALAQVYNVAAGMVGLPLGSKKTAGARQFATTSQMGLVRALSINRRFPVGEINRIREEIKIKPAFWDNPQLLQERIRSIDRSLRIRLEGERKASINTRLSSDSRQDALDAAKDIDNFLKILGNPPSFKDPSDPEFQALPSGSDFYFGDELGTKQ